MNRMKLIYLFGCLWIVFCMSMVMAQSSPNYRLTAIGVTEGSSFSSSSNYQAIPIIGQPVIGTSSSTQYRVRWGLIPQMGRNYGVLDPFITDTVRQLDISWLLPGSGTYSNGTSGWTVTTSGSGYMNVYSTANQLGFNLGTNSGQVLLATNQNDSVGCDTTRLMNLTGASIIADELQVVLVYQINSTLQGEWGARLYGYETCHALNMNLSIQPEDPLHPSWNGGRKQAMGCVLTTSSQEYDYLRRMEVYYQSSTTGSTASEIKLNQSFLTAVKVKP